MVEKQFNFTVVDGCLTVFANGKSIDLERESNPSLYSEALQAIRDKDNEALLEIITTKLDKSQQVAEFSDDNFEVRNGNLFLKGEYTKIPEHIARRVKEFMEDGLPYMPLVNFWKNVRQNPSQISYEGLLRFLEHNKQPITDDGCFIGYKKVKRVEVPEGGSASYTIHEKDGKRYYYVDTHSESFDNGPGSKLTMDRFAVDPDPNQTCSQGLHVAAWAYAAGFGGNVVMAVKVNPADVVAVPHDYDNQKIRTCGYEVLEECEVPHKDDYIKTDHQLEDLTTDELADLLDELNDERYDIQVELDDLEEEDGEEFEELQDRLEAIELEIEDIESELEEREKIPEEVQEEISAELDQAPSLRDTMSQSDILNRDEW